jgi:hypothetical protein
MVNPSTLDTLPFATNLYDGIRPQDTYKGMAYFGGTGPRGKTCGQCRFWLRKEAKKHAAACSKYSEMKQGEKGERFPDVARACKYFEQHDEAVRPL